MECHQSIESLYKDARQNRHQGMHRKHSQRNNGRALSIQTHEAAISMMKRLHNEAFTDELSHNQPTMAVALEGSCSCSSNSGSVASHFNSAQAGGVGASNSTKLTSAIAEYMYCKGLSLLSIEGTHFAQIIKLAKLAPSAFAPPSCKVLANKLLDLSYENRMEKFMPHLEMDADVYGFSLFGDGATVHGMPLMNILASGVHEPSTVLGIIDCNFANQFVCFYCYPTHFKFFFLCRCVVFFFYLGTKWLVEGKKRMQLTLPLYLTHGSRSWILATLVSIVYFLMEQATFN
jgi:hypothetical protein